MFDNTIKYIWLPLIIITCALVTVFFPIVALVIFISVYVLCIIAGLSWLGKQLWEIFNEKRQT